MRGIQCAGTCPRDRNGSGSRRALRGVHGRLIYQSPFTDERQLQHARAHLRKMNVGWSELLSASAQESGKMDFECVADSMNLTRG